MISINLLHRHQTWKKRLEDALEKCVRQISPLNALIVLVAFHLLGNTIWVKWNSAPPRWDEASHTTRALHYTNVLESLAAGAPDTTLFLKTFSDAYPPLVPMTTGALLSLLGPGIKLAQWMGTLFLIGAILAIYGLAKELTDNPWIGVLTAAFFSFYQVIYDNSRWLLLDIPLTAFVSLSLYLLLKSLRHHDKKYALFAGLSLAPVALTKLQGLIYLFVPFGLVLIKMAKKKDFSRIGTLVKGSILGGVLVLPWFLASLPNLQAYFAYAALGGEPLADPRDLTQATTWLFYLKLFINNALPLSLFLPLALPLIFVRNFGLPAREKWLVVGTLLFTYTWFTVLPNKDQRFLFPVYPLTAFLLSQGIIAFSKIQRTLAAAIVASVTATSIFMYVNLSFDYPLRKGKVWYLMLPYINDVTVFNLTDAPVARFSRGKWPYTEIIADITRLSIDKPTDFLFIPNYDHFNDNTFTLHLTLRKNAQIRLARAEGRQAFTSQGEIENYLNRFTLVLYTPDDVAVFYAPDRVAFEQLQQAISRRLARGEMRIEERYILPTGQRIWLLQAVSVL